MKSKDDIINSNLSDNEILRYARHLSLPEIGIKGQEKLKSSSVLCIGCGGLGSPLLIYLAAAGIGRIGIVDRDLIETSNLQRQIIHKSNSIGQKKIISAKESLQNVNPHCKIEIFDTSLTSKNALTIIESFDVICDCSDNFPTRYLINDACIILKKPNIYGSVGGFQGQASVFNLTSESPNFRDLVPIPPPKGIVTNCSEEGVMGVLPGIIGLIQATEAIKIITGTGETLSGRILVFDALKMVFKELNLLPIKPKIKIDKLIDYESFCSEVKDFYKPHHTIKDESISVCEFKEIIKHSAKDFTIIDVRDKHEYLRNSIQGAILIPIQDIKDGKALDKLKQISSKSDLYIYCKTGRRSESAIIELKRFGIKAINISGGLDAWEKQDSTND